MLLVRLNGQRLSKFHEVGTALRALLSTALARSGTSRRARASHSSTEREE